MIMIDWVTCCILWPHDEPINNGNVLSINADGVNEWTVDKWLPVRGSFDSTIQVRSSHKQGFCSHIELSGNPVKFMQGHNVWGTNDLRNLLADTFFKVIRLLNVSGFINHPDYPPLKFINCATISRVDLTAMYHLKNAKQVNTWLYSAERSAHTRHNGRSIMTHGTLYFGKSSKRWSIKFYHKGQELKDNAKHHRELPQEVLIWADKSLRCEVTLKRLELKRLGLRKIYDWQNVDVEDVYNKYFSKLDLSDNMHEPEDERLNQLPPRILAAYHFWKLGRDVKAMYPPRTFYRYRKELKDTLGVNISVQQPSQEPDRSNVVPLIRILEARPAEIPHWAHGTDLYYEPNAKPRLEPVA